MPKKITKEDAEKWLKANAQHIKILEWGDKSSAVSEFHDVNRDVKFKTRFNHLKTSIQRDPTYLFGATKKEKYEKVKRTNLERYGVESNLHLSSTREKIKNTFLEKYGVEHPSKTKEFQNKIRNTSIKKYGTSHPLKSNCVINKRKKTLIEKYGTSNPMEACEIKDKYNNTIREKYGVDHISKSPEIKKKVANTRIERGLTAVIDGKSIREMAEDKNCGYTTLIQRYNEFGEDFIKKWQPQKGSYIESMIESWLTNNKIEFGRNEYPDNLKENLFRPDFIMPKFNLIIECDGLLPHSDRWFSYKGKLYHKKKKEKYKELGYDSLFFREHEIRDKFSVIESIILNKLGKSKRIYARKCEIKDVDRKQAKQFFEENHLMGSGFGKTKGLYYKDILVCCMQVRWRNKKEKLLEVSRFCSLLNYSIVGGWSKLIKALTSQLKPNRIFSFVDMRYGSGDYLNKLGWTLKTNTVSFSWTDGKNLYHRSKFPSNSGYKHGLAKIWDCGQAKYELSL